jgi:hypothetical protein
MRAFNKFLATVPRSANPPSRRPPNTVSISTKAVRSATTSPIIAASRPSGWARIAASITVSAHSAGQIAKQLALVGDVQRVHPKNSHKARTGSCTGIAASRSRIPTPDCWAISFRALPNRREWDRAGNAVPEQPPPSPPPGCATRRYRTQWARRSSGSPVAPAPPCRDRPVRR